LTRAYLYRQLKRKTNENASGSSVRCDRLFFNATLATLRADRPGLGLIARGAVAESAGRIVYAAAMDGMPQFEAAERVDCDGRLITPGLIDCHTHLVHAGDRAREFEMRLAGVSYEEIARAGGGIVSTVTATRQAPENDLLAQSLPRLKALMAEGVTTLEIKSGYGLDAETEMKQLRVARRLGETNPVRVKTSYLGAHALPVEFRSDRAGYIDKICKEFLPAVARAKLADAVDGFCEGIAFSPEEIARVFEAASAHGLRVKLHADQLSNLHGANLVASFKGLSADHLEYADEEGAAAMSRAGTVAVLLPGAFYFIRETKVPPVELFRRHKVPMAIATDCNPGSSPLTSILLTMSMAATLFRMTVDECVAGVTREAARALDCLDEIGTLESGKRCDLAIWNVEQQAALAYRIGFNPLHARVFGGKVTLQ
jgi:imidazolonepropionase